MATKVTTPTYTKPTPADDGPRDASAALVVDPESATAHVPAGAEAYTGGTDAYTGGGYGGGGLPPDTTITFGAADASEVSAMGGMDYFAGTERAQDILDETTYITDTSKFYLSGKNLVNHMSPTAPYCLARGAMSLPAGSTEGWSFEPITPPAEHIIAGTRGAGRVGIGNQRMNSTYVDPDQDISVALENLYQYFHYGAPEPDLVTATVGGDSYGDAVYLSPYDYDVVRGGVSTSEEGIAISQKYGYTVTGADLPADTFGAVHARLSNEIDNLIADLQLGYSERRNISRSTSGVNIFNNFEAITEVENEEVIQEDSLGPNTPMEVMSSGQTTVGPADGGDY